ncbi:hypothetical protein GCM10007962_02800 [Yeosuana aromativorans]|uniref:PKD domain-containing protein n=1 Tax=Yeosuana aromativorans TaxID=288019 RepID=A0A8J3BHR2_9FLAO|nr:T9SS type B sorting domain-containing protein [Yeosuana aromativorans]GGK12001.1 hypothetical protein GCM10007962_02800 [Yeosuana aromativorans]
MFLILFSDHLVSQNETNNWYFGNEAGLSFNNGRQTVLTDGKMNTVAGCSSISDRFGNLLFYTNGKDVWNKDHVLMENGSNLAGDPNNTQSSIIIPKPNDDNVYYIFTTREVPSKTPLLTPGLFYSEVEFSSQFPLGKVVIKNIRLTSSITERITAIHHAASNTIRVITFGSRSSQAGTPKDTFYIFNVTENGVDRIPLIDKQNVNLSSAGAMKISPNGKILGLADYDGRLIYLYNFNNDTATLSFDKTLLADLLFTPINPYGLEFSQDSEVIFYSGKNQSNNNSYLIRFRLVDRSDVEGKTVVDVSSGYDFGSLQLASNGKIYMAIFVQNNPLASVGQISVINAPSDNSDIGYQPLGIDLQTGESLKGLPIFVQSFFRNRILTENQCVSDTFNFSFDTYAPATSALWDFDDGTTSSLVNPNHKYSKPGLYFVKATLTINNQPVEIYKQVMVYALPQIDDNQVLSQCDTDNDGHGIFNLYNIEEKMSKRSNTDYEFYFYNTHDDAINDTNEIANPDEYENKSNPEELFVKIINPEGCITITNFFIETTYTVLDPIDPMFSCELSDDVYNNGVGAFDLKSKLLEIRSQFNIPETSRISFYESFQEAQKKTNSLPFHFESTTTTVWVRIEDSNFGCYGIQSIDLEVNSAIEININDSYTICDPSIYSNIVLDGGNSNDSWAWKDNNGNIISTKKDFEITQAGSFSLTISKTENQVTCSTTKNFIVYESGFAKFDTVTAEDYQIKVTITGESDYEYSLDNTSFSGQGLEHKFLNVSAGIYTVYVRDKNNCEPTISTKVSIIGFPKYFTPNNDGNNDVWKVEGISDDLYISADISIFDRYGKPLYNMDLTKNQNGWDGTYNGSIVTSTDYWFKATLVDKNNDRFVKLGHFSLKQ